MESIIVWVLFGAVACLVAIEIIAELKAAYIESGIF